MSQGAIYNLVLRDDRFDKYFTASDYLRSRLDGVRKRRLAEKRRLVAAAIAKGIQPSEVAYDVQPTWFDITKTHHLFIRAHYRPYVAVASEYTKVKPSGDGTAYIGLSGGRVKFDFPTWGHFTSDMAVRIRFNAVGTESPTFAPDGSTTAPLYRYCAYPGLRLLKAVEFKSNSTRVDDYTRDEAVKYMKFFTRVDNRAGWSRCHGQQETKEAAYDVVGVGNTSAYTQYMLYADGPQTPKYYHAAFDLMVPLQFDFCSSSERALLNDLLPNTQRTIEIDLAPLTDVLESVVISSGGGGGAFPDVPVFEYVPTALPITRLGVTMELYVNNLWTNPEIHDIFASRIGFSLFRVHRRQTTVLQAPGGMVLTDQLKFPVEYFTVGVRDRANSTSFDYWWLMGTPPVSDDNNRLLAAAMVWNSVVSSCQLVCREARDVVSLDSVVYQLGFTTKGIEYFQLSPTVFYNGYLPMRYAELSRMVSPIDVNESLLPMSLYPGLFQPSGHLNLSAGRENYITYELNTAGAALSETGAIEMVISGSFLNFLVRIGDSVQLRYSV